MESEKLLKEINRFKSINNYSTRLYLREDEVETGAPITDPNTETPPADPNMETPPADPNTETPPIDSNVDSVGTDPMLDTSEVEEVDVTDLVNMTKNIKNKLESTEQEQNGVLGRMNDVFTKLDDLERKLSSMDMIINRIDQLGEKVERMRPPTPEEKLEMRSLDSYPFNTKPQEFFANKQQEMRASGKNEYILTKNDIQNYSNNLISKTFNPYNDEEFRQ